MALEIALGAARYNSRYQGRGGGGRSGTMDSPLRSILVGVGPGGSTRALEAAAALA